jgi:hypothetical protein
MKISLSHTEVNEVLVAWAKSHILDLPENAEFDVSGSFYSEVEIRISVCEPNPPERKQETD